MGNGMPSSKDIKLYSLIVLKLIQEESEELLSDTN